MTTTNCCIATTVNKTVRRILTKLLLGVFVFLVMGTQKGWGQIATWTFQTSAPIYDIALQGTGVVPPANDDCSGAITIIPGGAICTPVLGTTVNATQSIAPSLCSGHTEAIALDVWYKFVSTSTQHIISVKGTGGFNPSLDFRSGSTCNGNPFVCYDGAGPNGTESAFLSTSVGTALFIRVYGSAGTTGTFEVCIASPLLCPTPYIVTVGSVTSSSASVSWDCSGCTGTFDLDYGPSGHAAGTGTIITGVTSPYTLNSLTGNTVYTVYVRQNCAANGFSPWSGGYNFITLPGPPANDDCANAISLSVPTACSPVAGTTLNATQSLAAITCGTTGNANDDVWYKFVASNTVAAITVAGSSGFDAVVDLRSGACNGTNIACANLTGPNGTETINATGLTIGATYYVRVYDFGSGAGGTFTICVTSPICNTPTSVMATAIISNSASISWTCSGCTGSFELDYGPSGHAAGTGTIITGVTSPYTLNPPLTPGTAYTVYVRQNCTGNGFSAWSSGANFTTCATPAITLGSIPAICAGATSASLPYTSTTNGPDQYSIDYDDASITDVTNSTLPASPIGLILPGSLTSAGSPYSGTLTVRNSVTGCESIGYGFTVTVLANNTAGPASSSPTICANTALSPAITHTTTGATGIGTATGLPPGVTASFGSNTITISGTPTAAGTFNYSIPLTGGCGSANATGTITVLACSTTWLGGIDNNWFNPSNWSGGIVPTATLDVIIPTGTPNPCVIPSGAAQAHDLLINTSASLTVSSGASLNINGGGVVTNNGTLTNNGTFNQ